MKKNNIFKVTLLVILVAIVCTWLFPTIQYGTDLVEGERVQVGIFTLTEYMVVLFRYFFYIVLTTLACGAFYGVAYRIPAYRDFLDMIVAKFKGKENIFLIAVMAIIAILVSVTGFQVGMLFVFPLIISIVVLMGYNKLVAASVTVGPVMVGVMGTTLGVQTTEYINSILKIEYSSAIVGKIVILVLGLALLCYNVVMYAKKTRNETDKELEFVPFRNKLAVATEEIKVEEVKPVKEVKEVKKEEKKDTKKKAAKKKAPAKKSSKTKANNAKTSDVKVVKTSVKKPLIWPFIVVFDVALLIMLLSVFSWTTLKATWATDALNAITGFKIFKFPIFAKILGQVGAFGSWTLMYEIPLTIFVFTGILALVYRVKFDKFIEGVLDGMKRAFVPALVMFLSYMVLIIVTYSPFQLYVAKFFLGLTKGLNVVTLTITMMVSSVLNVEPLYVAQSTLPYVTSVITDSALYPVIGVVTQAVYGLMMLIAPTSVVLMGTLCFLEIPYTRWIKHIWKLFLELLVVLLVVFLILSLI